VAVAVLSTVAGFHVPVIPLLDISGKTGGTVPMQKEGISVNEGIIFGGVTVTVSVVDCAHCPGAGVNVYVAVAVLSTVAGLHVPVIPSLDIDGKTGAVVPIQKEATGVNEGIVFGALTVTVSVVDVAHWPGAGVKVYVAVAVLSTVAGFHVPVIPSLDVSGKTGAVVPIQKGAIAVNAGTVLGELTVTVSVVSEEHWPEGWKV
jgi:hypothetical protein